MLPKLRTIDQGCEQLTNSMFRAGAAKRGSSVDQRDFIRANCDREGFPVPILNAVIELIVSLSLCAGSLHQLADDVAHCASCANDFDERQDLLAAARNQRIQILEMQGMLAALTDAYIERCVAGGVHYAINSGNRIS